MILAGHPEQLRICDCPCDVRPALPANRLELIDSVRTLLMEDAQQARLAPQLKRRLSARLNPFFSATKA